MLIDSHCHLDHLDLTQHDLPTILAEAKAVGIGYILAPGVDLEHFPHILEIANKYENIGVSVGVHPTEEVLPPSFDELLNFAVNPLVKGIGETGLDYAQCEHDCNLQLSQQALFTLQIEVAKKVKKPLVIHARAADRDMINILTTSGAREVGGVMHCFTGSWDVAKIMLDLDFYLSFSGIITFKNAASLREVVMKVPLERMLIETDAPFLAPVPMRGKSNVPAYLRYIAEFIASLRNISLEELAEKTSANFWRLF
jgi:TatD DNase family protein